MPNSIGIFGVLRLEQWCTFLSSIFREQKICMAIQMCIFMRACWFTGFLSPSDLASSCCIFVVVFFYPTAASDRGDRSSRSTLAFARSLSDSVLAKKKEKKWRLVEKHAMNICSVQQMRPCSWLYTPQTIGMVVFTLYRKWPRRREKERKKTKRLDLSERHTTEQYNLCVSDLSNTIRVSLFKPLLTYSCVCSSSTIRVHAVTNHCVLPIVKDRH